MPAQTSNARPRRGRDFGREYCAVWLMRGNDCKTWNAKRMEYFWSDVEKQIVNTSKNAPLWILQLISGNVPAVFLFQFLSAPLSGKELLQQRAAFRLAHARSYFAAMIERR